MISSQKSGDLKSNNQLSVNEKLENNILDRPKCKIKRSKSKQQKLE